MLGALVSFYVPLAAYQVNLGTGFPTPPVFFVLGAAFAAVGVAGGLLTWRRSKFGSWLLLIGTIAGLALWPWLTTALIYLLASAISVVALWRGRRTNGRTGAAATHVHERIRRQSN